MSRKFDHVHIERYLLGIMQDAELTEFENAIQADQSLKKSVDLYRQAFRSVNFSIREETRKELQRIDRKMDRAKNPPVLHWRVAAIAASILLVICAGIWIWAGNYYSKQAIVQRMEAGFEQSNWRSERADAKEGSIAKMLTEASQHFQDGDFATAESMYLELSHAETVWKEYAEWQLLLTHFMQEEDSEEFDDLLNALLMQPDHAYHQDALKLSRILDSPLYPLGW